MNESVSQIYVVDDDESVREAVGGLIRSAGLRVKTFASGKEILIDLENELPRSSRSSEHDERSGVFGEIIGQSKAWRQIVSEIEVVAPMDATVLLLGDTGTGKELIARELHRRSRRKDNALIRVNCACIPKELYESEFFGHAKGAFTGAVKDRIGRFEAAAGGTLFLDEIGEIPLELQSKLLRVLQEKCYERLGEARTRRTDVRIVAATNRDLKREVAAGRFREDLYYRLNVFPIRVAPLRERREDIPLLASHFIELSVKELGCPRPKLTQAGLQTLQAYDWPGNIRELRNLIERAAILVVAEFCTSTCPRWTPQSISVLPAYGRKIRLNGII
jgi:transcriptional regulator with GAF, ATPase, and Fis domain